MACDPKDFTFEGHEVSQKHYMALVYVHPMVLHCVLNLLDNCGPASNPGHNNGQGANFVSIHMSIFLYMADLAASIPSVLAISRVLLE